MTLMKRFLIALSVTVMLVGCSRPTEKIIPTDMATWDKELAPVVQKLGNEDKQLITAYIARLKIKEMSGVEQGGVPFGVTVGQAIEEQKKWVIEQKRQAEEEAAVRAKQEKEEAALRTKIEAEKLDAIRAVNDAVTVTLLGKKELRENYEAGRYSDAQEFTIGVQNKSEKIIVGVLGEIEFIDVFSKRAGAVHFGISEKIKPGATYTWVGTRRYNQFVDEHKAVWNLEEGKYTTKFIPEAVVFSDGAKLTMPE
jgi:hypothetical protein